MTDRPLRILTVADVPPDPNSGAAGTVYHTNVALRELGHTVDEIWADQLGPRKIAHGNLHSLLEQPRAYRREAMKAIDREAYDLVIMSQPQAYLAAKAMSRSAFRGIVVNRSHGVELRADEVLSHWHMKLGISQSRFPTVTRFLRPLLHRQWSSIVRWCDGIFVGSQLDRDFLLKRFNLRSDRVRTIVEGITNSLLTSRASLADNSNERWKRVLYVGQFAFFKAPFLLADAFNHLLRLHRDVRLSWVCSADHHSQIEKLLSPAIRGQVDLIGWMAADELVKVYDRHGIFVFPSLFEGFGKTPFEAMARGLCVVASREGAMRDLITDEKTGYLIDVGDVASITNRLEVLFGDPELTANIGSAGRQAIRHYSWNRCASEIVEFFGVLRQAKKNGDLSTKVAM